MRACDFLGLPVLACFHFAQVQVPEPVMVTGVLQARQAMRQDPGVVRDPRMR